MTPSRRKVHHDLLSNPGRSILIILSIAVGLFAIGTIMTVWLCLADDIRIGYEEINPANIYFKLSKFDNSLVRSIQSLPEISHAQGSRSASLRTITAKGDLENISLNATEMDSWQVNKVEVLEGSWPLKKGEIALENFKFSLTGYKIGDSIPIRTDSGKDILLTIVARVRDPSLGVINYSQVFMAPITGYIHPDTLTSVELPKNWNLLNVVINGDGNDLTSIQDVSKIVTDRIEKSGISINSVTLAKTSVHPISDYIDAIAGVLFIVGILILFLSGTLIFNTLSAILSQQIKQIGAMKTIGASSGKLNRMYFYLIFLFSLAALILAIPLSMVAASWFRRFLASAINYRIVLTGIIWQTIIVQILLGIIIPQLSGILPVRKGVRISIQEALNTTGSARLSAHDNSSRMFSWATRLFSRPVALSLRNMISNRLRLFLTLLTLSIGGGIFIATFNVTETIDNHTKAISRYFMAEYSANLMTPAREDRVTEILKTIEGVDFVEGWGAGTAVVKLVGQNDGPNVQILAPSDHSQLIVPKMKEGRWYEPGEINAIALSEKFMTGPSAFKVGDEIELEINSSGLKRKWVVVGFFTMAGKSGGYMGYMPLSSWQEVSGLGSRTTRFEIKIHEGMDTDSENKLRQIEDALTANGYKVRSIQRNDHFIHDAASGLSILSAFMFIMAILVAIVGSIGMTGTMSLNVMERTREIGILRSIGASDKAVLQNIMTEGIMIGVLSWIGGIVLSFPFFHFLSQAMGNAVFGSMMDPAYTWVGYVVWLGFSLFFAALASLMPARSAIRLTIQEVLSAE